MIPYFVILIIRNCLFKFENYVANHLLIILINTANQTHTSGYLFF